MSRSAVAFRRHGAEGGDPARAACVVHHVQVMPCASIQLQRALVASVAALYALSACKGDDRAPFLDCKKAEPRLDAGADAQADAATNLDCFVENNPPGAGLGQPGAGGQNSAGAGGGGGTANGGTGPTPGNGGTPGVGGGDVGGAGVSGLGGTPVAGAPGLGGSFGAGGLDPGGGAAGFGAQGGLGGGVSGAFGAGGASGLGGGTGIGGFSGTPNPLP